LPLVSRIFLFYFGTLHNILVFVVFHFMIEYYYNSRLHKSQPKPVPVTPMTMDDGDDDKELEEIEVLAELAEIMGPGTEASTNGAKSSM